MTSNINNTVVAVDDELDSSSSSSSGSSSCSISSVHPDIIQTHILSRLDGASLASASCASSELHRLIEMEAHRLWKNITSSTWPSTNTPRIQHIISTFPPSAHRSFFSDAYHTTSSIPTTTTKNNNNCTTGHKLISAVDIYYKKNINKGGGGGDDDVILSKVVELNNTDTTWFKTIPFRVDLLDPPKKQTSVPINHQLQLQHHHHDLLRLSWILIDPILKRAVNLSSFRPVSVETHWFTGHVQVRFGSVVVSSSEEDYSYYYCDILVTCDDINASSAGGVVLIREVRMHVEDVDGRILNGEDSMVIFQRILQQDRKTNKIQLTPSYVDWMEMKRVRRDKKERRERNLDNLCMSLAFAIFTFLLSLLLLR